jgi:hypothetical protein
VSIIIDILAAWGALSLACTGFVVWWGIARSRRRDRAAQDDEMALADATKEPGDAEIERMTRDYYREGGNRG